MLAVTLFLYVDLSYIEFPGLAKNRHYDVLILSIKILSLDLVLNVLRSTHFHCLDITTCKLTICE